MSLPWIRNRYLSCIVSEVYRTVISSSSDNTVWKISVKNCPRFVEIYLNKLTLDLFCEFLLSPGCIQLQYRLLGRFRGRWSLLIPRFVLILLSGLLLQLLARSRLFSFWVTFPLSPLYMAIFDVKTMIDLGTNERNQWDQSTSWIMEVQVPESGPESRHNQKRKVRLTIWARVSVILYL